LEQEDKAYHPPLSFCEKIYIKVFSLEYSNGKHSLIAINLRIPSNSIAVLFGPSGGGKSTLLRMLNRLNDLADVKAIQGDILLDGKSILGTDIDIISLRRRVGMVIERPVGLPMSIKENLTYILEIAGEKDLSKLDEAV